MPVQTAPDQTYGLAGQQQAAQQAMPLAPPPPPGRAAPPASPGGPVPAGPGPGQVIPLDAPTQRPDEPVTHGLALGPGAGPEALSMNQPTGFLADKLDDLARTSGNTDLQVLAARARQLGQ